MNKEELVKICSNSTGLTQKNIRITLDAITTTIKNQVANGEDITIQGFGKFTAVEHKAKQCHNPNNPKETMLSSISRKPKFKAARDFQQIVNS